jgi:hypothetical protein
MSNHGNTTTLNVCHRIKGWRRIFFQVFHGIASTNFDCPPHPGKKILQSLYVYNILVFFVNKPLRIFIRRQMTHLTSRLSKPRSARFFSICLRISNAAFAGSGSTAKVAPSTSFKPSVSNFTMFMLPVIGGIGPRTV